MSPAPGHAAARGGSVQGVGLEELPVGHGEPLPWERVLVTAAGSLLSSRAGSCCLQCCQAMAVPSREPGFALPQLGGAGGSHSPTARRWLGYWGRGELPLLGPRAETFLRSRASAGQHWGWGRYPLPPREV